MTDGLYIYERFIDTDGREKIRLRCAHRQAEPVTLITGEQVACVCIDCLAQLPADYIERQRVRAHHVATCKHTTKLDITGFGDPIPRYMCAHCGMESAGAY